MSVTTQDNGKPFPAEPLTIIIMNTEELYIWNYGIGKLPKGLLEYGRSDTSRLIPCMQQETGNPAI